MVGKAGCRNSEKGQSMVEFAFALSFLMMLLVGIVDVSRGLFTYMALREAAQEGAVYGAVNPSNNTDIQSRATNSSTLVRNLADDPSASFSVDVTFQGARCTGNGIVVKVTYSNFPITMPFIGAVLGRQQIPISASVSDVVLSPVCSE